MTAGSGIIHQEMPKADEARRMSGLQLWANLPASQKMMDPRYRDLTADRIPEVTLEGDVRVKVIAGRVGDTEGPMDDVVIQPEVLDVRVPAGKAFAHPTTPGHTAAKGTRRPPSYMLPFLPRPPEVRASRPPLSLQYQRMVLRSIPVFRSSCLSRPIC